MKLATHKQGLDYIVKYLNENNVNHVILYNRHIDFFHNTCYFSIIENYECAYLSLFNTETQYDETFCFYIPEDYQAFKTVMDILFLPLITQENGRETA